MSGETLRARDLFIDGFTEGVLRWLERTAPAEPVYCLALVCVGGDPFFFGPMLALGLERERAPVVSSGAALWRIWSVCDFELWDGVPRELEAMREHWDAMAREWLAEEDVSGPRELYVACAQRLAALDSLPGVRPGDAFAVFAVDDELADLERNLEVTVPAEVRQTLEWEPPKLR